MPASRKQTESDITAVENGMPAVNMEPTSEGPTKLPNPPARFINPNAAAPEASASFCDGSVQ
jgi:hypothetical protein